MGCLTVAVACTMLNVGWDSEPFGTGAESAKPRVTPVGRPSADGDGIGWIVGGAAAYLVAGFGVGAPIGAFTTNWFNGGWNGARPDAIVTGGLIGAAVGAVAGGLLGLLARSGSRGGQLAIWIPALVEAAAVVVGLWYLGAVH